MKKTIAFILALMMCLPLCACDNGTQSESTLPTNESTAVTATPAETTIPEEITVSEETTLPEETTAPEETTVPEETESALVDGMRPEFKEAMDAYETFYDEYCEFMVEFQKNPSDLTLLAEYGELLIKVAEMDEAFEKWTKDEMNDAELKYYLEVSNRVMQKLVDVTG